MCGFTKGQIGWRNSDASPLPDPLDMNTIRSEWIFDVNQGDLVEIKNELAQLVKTWVVSADNRDLVNTPILSGRWVSPWDATNNQGDRVAISDNYSLLVNGVSRNDVVAVWADDDPEVFTSYSKTSTTINFTVDYQDSWGAYVTILVYDAGGQVVDRPVLHKFFASGPHSVNIPGLDCQHTVRLYSSDAGGNDASATILPEVTTPTNLTANNCGCKPGLPGCVPFNYRIGLNWEYNYANPDNFKIYRDGVYITSVGPTVRSYDDENLVWGQSYTYNVTALKGTCESPVSNSVTSTPSSGAPNNPTSLTLSRLSQCTYRANWNGTSINNENGFELAVEYTCGGTTTTSYWLAPANATSLARRPTLSSTWELILVFPSLR